MSYEVYKILHLLAVLFLYLSLGAAVATAGSANLSLRRLGIATHGIAMLVIVVAGFGLLARLGVGGVPGWAWAKLGVWLLLGLAVIPLRRRARWAPLLWFVLPVLGGFAAWLAVTKPF